MKQKGKTMITFEKRFSSRGHLWIAPKIGKEEIFIKYRTKGAYDVFVYNPSYGTEYIGTYDEKSEAKDIANTLYETFQWLEDREQHKLPHFSSKSLGRS